MELKHILDYGENMVKKETNLEKIENKQKEIELTAEERNEILHETFTDMNDNETPTDAENLSEIIKAWLDDKYIHAKTRLNQNQIIALTILKTLAEKYNVRCIKELIDNFVRYKLSEGGQSSKELVDILKARTEVEMDDSLSKAIEPFIR